MQNKVFMYWHSNNIPTEYQNYIDNNKKLCPNLDFVIFNQESARNFIENNYPQDHIHAYDKLKPYAYKCDLWRLCILNSQGGIYIDAKVQFTNSFKPWLKNHTLDNNDKCVFLQDYGHGAESYIQPDNSIIKYPDIQNSFIISTKNNKFLKLTIDNIVQNVKDNYYGQTPLSVSGPGLLGRLYHLHKNNFNSTRILPLSTWQNLLSIKFQIRSQTNDQIHYHHMWHNKDIYNNI